MTTSSSFKQTIYLDLCCYNRPFDEQRQTRVHMETQAKLEVQELAKQGLVRLVWSYVLDYENSLNPVASRRQSIELWRDIAHLQTLGDDSVLESARKIEQAYSLKSFDALHVACAITSNAHLFITTDDFILRKMKLDTSIRVVNPVEALAILENWYAN